MFLCKNKRKKVTNQQYITLASAFTISRKEEIKNLE